MVQSLHGITQIRAVYAIIGTFGYIALIEAETTHEMVTVVDLIGSIPGVDGTQSAIVLSTKFDRH